MDNIPARTGKDHLHAGVKAVVGAVPFAGSALQVLMETVFASPVERRKEAWLQGLAATVAELCAKVEGLSPEALAANEMFITAASQATYSALRTHSIDKLDALRNAVYNAAALKVDENEQLLFLRLVDEFTPGHLRVLAFYRGPQQWIAERGLGHPSNAGGSASGLLEFALPEFKGRGDVYGQLVRDLQQRGLMMNGDFLNTYMTWRSQQSSAPV